MQQKKFTGKVYLKKGQTIHVKIKRLGINGEGIGYYKKKIIFIPGALPKEFVKAKITESNRNYAKAKLLEIVENQVNESIRPIITMLAESNWST